MGRPDYTDSPDNIFSDDYISDGLFGEEDEEVGNDFHEIDLGNPTKAAAVTEAYKDKRYDEIGDTPTDKKPRVRGKLPPKMVKNGVQKLIIIKANKIIILLP